MKSLIISIFILTCSSLLASEEYYRLPNPEIAFSEKDHSIDSLKWIPADMIQEKDIDNEKTINLRFFLNDTLQYSDYLYLSSYADNFTVLSGTDTLYSFSTKLNHSRFYGNHVIPLKDIKDRTFYISFKRENKETKGYFDEIIVGSTRGIFYFLQGEQKKQILTIGTTFLLLFFALGSILYFIFRIKSRQWEFLYFAFFCINSAIDYSFPSTFTLAFNLNPAAGLYIIFLNSFLLPIGFIALVNRMIFKNKQLYFRLLLYFHLLIVSLFILFYWQKINYTPLFFIFWILEIVDTVIVTLVLLLSRKAKRFKNPITLTCYSIFLLSVFIELISENLNLNLPNIYGIGILFLVIAMIKIMADNYRETINKIWNYSYELQLNKNKLLSLEQENLKSQLEALKTQINPHFLFNSLSTLMSIIEEDKEQAIDFVEELSRVYRYILQSFGKDLSSVENEIDFLKSYIFLLSKRFGKNLQVNIKIDSCLFTNKIPSLSLHLLVENAVKHNVVSSKKPLFINIFCEDCRLVVQNNLQPKNQVILSSGMGLENIRKRYSFFTKNEIEIIKTEETFTVIIPLLSE